MTGPHPYLYSNQMFAAQPGILAQYQEKEQYEKSASSQTVKPVIAFTDDGIPMVIGNEETEYSRNLVRADSYDNYIGMAYHPVVAGPLGLYRARSERAGQKLASGSVAISEIDFDERMIANMTQWEIAAVEFAALRALELAGKRQLGNSSRSWRGELREVPSWEIHTHIKVTNVEKALSGAYDLLRTCLPGQDDVYLAIDDYVRERIRTQRLHDPRRLLATLTDAGCLARLP